MCLFSCCLLFNRRLFLERGTGSQRGSETEGQRPPGVRIICISYIAYIYIYIYTYTYIIITKHIIVIYILSKGRRPSGAPMASIDRRAPLGTGNNSSDSDNSSNDSSSSNNNSSNDSSSSSSSSSSRSSPPGAPTAGARRPGGISAAPRPPP